MSSYTLEDLDAAIAESIGPRMWEVAQGPGFSRVLLIDRAATARFWAKTEEDINSYYLRVARADLEKSGCLQPLGGWNEETEGKEPWE